MVYEEIVGNQEPRDELAKWVKTRRDKGLCIKSDRQVQGRLTRIQDHIFSNYHQAECLAFSRGADPWLIAHAWQDDGVVVTWESSRKPGAKKVLIPNVCDHFGIKCFNTYEMLKTLKAKL